MWEYNFYYWPEVRDTIKTKINFFDSLKYKVDIF